MKHVLGLAFLLLAGLAGAASLPPAVAEALATFERVIVPTDRAAGFHSLEMPKQRNFSPDVPITVDSECLRFAIVKASRDEPVCRRHADIKKVSIAPTRDDWYGKTFPGDYNIVVSYKGLGRLIVLTLSAEDVDPFLDAVRVLSPSLTKIKDPR